MNNNYLFLFSLYFLLASCTHQNPQRAIFLKILMKFRKKYLQYIIQGKILYSSRCSNCHQHSGQGFRKLYPALINSNILMNNIGSAACLIKHGTKRGDEASNLNILMPAQTELSNLEIAEILTYIGNSWGNQQIYFRQQCDKISS